VEHCRILQKLHPWHSRPPDWATSLLPLGLRMLASWVASSPGGDEASPPLWLGCCVALNCSAHRSFASLRLVLVLARFLPCVNFLDDVGGMTASGPSFLLREDKWFISLVSVNWRAGSTLSFSSYHPMGIAWAWPLSMMNMVLAWGTMTAFALSRKSISR